MFHLGWFGTTGPVNWLAPSGAIYDWRKPEIFQDVAKLCERAKMDFVMFADSVAIPALFQGSTDYYVRNGFMIYHDPVPTCAWMAAATQRIGLADHGSQCDRRMRDQAILDLAGPDPVAR